MTGRARRTLVAGLPALGILLLVPETAFAQCAMCGRAFASPEGQQLVSAFRAGILVLLAAPLLSFVTVAFLAVRRQRRHDSISLNSEARSEDQIHTKRFGRG